jgi:hypothetical protein
MGNERESWEGADVIYQWYFTARMSAFAGKCPEILTVFALKQAHLPPIMNSGTRVG